MSFKELAYAGTPLGGLSLRRRTELKLGVEVYEIKLNDEYLMSSLFTVAEEELARMGLAALDIKDMDVVVGGLGLGYTARAALENDNLKSLIVVDMLKDVISWHQEKILPLGETLCADQRCRMVEGDFFKMARTDGFDPDQPGRRFHAILLDIDHAPDHNLDQSHVPFYSKEGLTQLAQHIYPGGVFALWSNDPPDPSFLDVLGSVFPEANAHVVSFDNPLQGKQSSNTVYIARNSG